MVRRTKAQALETRGHILDAAEHLFQARGVSRTTLQDIANGAGVTRGAVYWHFRNKAELFNSMMDRVSLPMLDAQDRAPAGGADDALTHLRTSLLDALRLSSTDPRTRRVFEIATQKVEYVDELLAVRDWRVACRERCLEQIRGDLRRARRRGGTALAAPGRSASIGLHALIDGLIQNWLLDPQAFDLLKVGRQALDVYLAGLGIAPAAPTRPALSRPAPARRRLSSA